MRLLTHIMFAMGLVLYTTGSAYAAVFAVLAQVIIDVLGHTHSHGYVRRSWVTHDAILSLLTVVLPMTLLTTYYVGNLLLSTYAMTLALYSHLFLDWLTEGCIFIMRKRVGGLGIPYNQPVANTLFILLGILLLFMAIH